MRGIRILLGFFEIRVFGISRGGRRGIICKGWIKHLLKWMLEKILD